MSRKCDLSAVGPMSGNNVSHAKNRNRRRFLPNLRSVHLRSEALGEEFRLTVAAATLRTVEHRGGLDAHLMRERTENLSSQARDIRRRLLKQSGADSNSAPAPSDTAPSSPAPSA